MATIAQVAEAMRTILTTTAEAAARRTDFVQRQSKVSGPVFAQTLVLGWLDNPQATLEELCQTTATLGVSLSEQGLEQRFTPQAAACVREVLEAAVTQVIAADPVAIPLLQRCSAVLVEDSTSVSLPAALAEVWQGCGGHVEQGQAALKLQVRLDLVSGALGGPLLQDGRASDHHSPFQTQALPLGTLTLKDLGYFSLDVLARQAAEGSYWLTRLQVRTAVFDARGQRWEVGRLLAAQRTDQVDLPVTLGVEHRLPARLLAVRVPPEVSNARRRKLHAEARSKGQLVSKARLALADWTILVTNAPLEVLTLAESMVLARARWQIELLFKLWKQHGYLDEWRSAKPWRILCEVYGKLLALVVQHWLLVLSCWAAPNRSLVKGAQTVRRHVLLLALALRGVLKLTVALQELSRTLATGCRMNRRKQKPHAYQLLLDLKEEQEEAA